MLATRAHEVAPLGIDLWLGRLKEDPKPALSTRPHRITSALPIWDRMLDLDQPSMMTTPDSKTPTTPRAEAMAFAKLALLGIGIGACVGTGHRAIEWVIPAPERSIVVCLADELGTAKVCKTLDEMLKASEARR